MQASAWIGLLRRIPTSYHDALLLMTTTGNEVVLQRIIRMERDFLICMGRLSGSTDQAKLLVLPFAQLAYLTFVRPMSEGEITTVLGKPGIAVQAATTESLEEVAAAVEEMIDEAQGFAPEPVIPPEEPKVLPVEEPVAVPSAKNPPKVAPPSKSILLARLRERLANDIAKQGGNGHG